jgi:endonuclease III
MAQPSRTAQIARIHKILKKYYKPVNPAPDRSVIEHLLFACCLENAPYEAAEEAFAALSHNFFDWNEIRVSTVRELAEEMPRLPDPAAAGQRIKRVLQSIFDATYSFDLEDLHKLNLGAAAEKLAKLEGSTPFTVAYVVQAALGGHSIPIDQGVIKALEAADMVTAEEIQSGQIGGLERAIAKSKGFEFGSLIHQLGADFIANSQSPALVQILVDLNPAAAERLTKRPKKADESGRQPAAKGDAAAGPQRPSEAGAGEGEPEAKKKRPETRKKTGEKPAPPGHPGPAGAESPAHESKPAEAKAAEAKRHEPKAAEGKPVETRRAEPRRAAGHSAVENEPPAKPQVPKPAKTASGETRPAEAKPAASKLPATKEPETKGSEPKSSGKQNEHPVQPATDESRTAAERKKKTPEEAPAVGRKKPGEQKGLPQAEAPAGKRKPAAMRKEAPAKKEPPAAESKDHLGGEKEKRTAATS